MNDQQQKALTNPGVANPVPVNQFSPDIQLHNSLGSYVGGRPIMLNKPSYQTEPASMAQFSHLNQHQQSSQQMQAVHGYQGHRQMSPDFLLAQKYPSTIGTTSALNAAYQAMAGFDLENGQLSMQHQAPQHHQYQNHQQPLVEASPQHHYYQPPQVAAQPQPELQSPHHHHSSLISAQQQHHHLVQQQQHQQRQYQVPKEILQPQQSAYQQQEFQIQQHLQQRSRHQQHTYQQQLQQPKQILQHTPTTSSVLQQPQQPINQSSLPTQQISSPGSANMHQQHAYQQQQPKHILQHAPSISSVLQQTQQPISQPSPQTQQHTTTPTATTNMHQQYTYQQQIQPKQILQHAPSTSSVLQQPKQPINQPSIQPQQNTATTTATTNLQYTYQRQPQPKHILQHPSTTTKTSSIVLQQQLPTNQSSIQTQQQTTSPSTTAVPQQHAYQQQVPKQILQNPSATPKSSLSVLQQPPTKTSPLQPPQQTSTGTTNMHPKQPPKQILQHPLDSSKIASNVLQQALVSQPQQQTTTATITNSPSGSDDVKQDIDKVEEKPANNGLSQEPKNNASEKLSVANTKEKTPLCLINELAHYNKLYHQYVLVDEQGPAHKKTFQVKLKLADEEYSASGDSIKKAQNAAAGTALVETKFPHPPQKPTRFSAESIGKNLPSSELHVLAMKRGETVTYKTIEPRQSPYYRQPGMDYRGLYNMRYHQYMHSNRDSYYSGNGVTWPQRQPHLHMNRTFYVCLRVGRREFIADGLTRQEARHNATQKALRALKNLPVENDDKIEQDQKDEDVNDGLKSEISLVHEIALRRNMDVNFEVISELGPPHLKHFMTKCTVGDMVTEGDGNSKRTSKKKAAELMLEELKKLPATSFTPAIPRPKTKFQSNKKKNRNLVKSELQQQKADSNYGTDINPISRLIQIMQAKKKKEPVYTLVSERGLPRREFIIQVEVEDKTCTGTAPNKKLAKRSAAETMLEILGYTKQGPQPVKSSLKPSLSVEGNQTGDKRVKFVESGSDDKVPSSSTPPSQQQQRIPGLLHLPANSIKTSITSGGGKDQQSFHMSRGEPSRDKVADDVMGVLLDRIKSVHLSGDGPPVKKDVFTRPSTNLRKDNL